MAQLRVVCLISGGKDSLFSILHCLANGHEVLALANLHPSRKDVADSDDLDSFMYQTVGHDIVPCYQEALDLPLYRHETRGVAANLNKCYDPTAPPAGVIDETEDLLPLLEKVKTAHPEINAISTGAILSDYQRTRVESIAIRLGLTPLSYLWQWPRLPSQSQTSLLEQMAAVGQDARLVKVASGGLDDGFLWRNVADASTISKLAKTAERFGTFDDGAVLGEGGEYETISLSGPAPLWKGRIIVDDKAVRKVRGEAGSASVRVTKVQVMPTMAGDTTAETHMRIPPLLGSPFSDIMESLRTETIELSQSSKDIGPTPTTAPTEHLTESPDNPDHLCLFGLTGEGTTVGEQARSIMDEISIHLERSSHKFSDICYTSIILADMADFSSVNAVYGSYFTQANPPARLTISCANVLPEGKRLMLSATCVRTRPDAPNNALHVQSRSYWAPANIGPYSQAKSAPHTAGHDRVEGNMVFISGQIPLIPATMELVSPLAYRLYREDVSLPREKVQVGNSMQDPQPDPFLLETVLAMQHFVSVGRVMQVSQWYHGAALITACSKEDAGRKGRIARKAWDMLHAYELGNEGGETSEPEETDVVDVWDIKYGNARKPGAYRGSETIRTSRGDLVAPELHVFWVDALPRGSSIEWATFGMTEDVERYPSNPHFEHIVETLRKTLVE